MSTTAPHLSPRLIAKSLDDLRSWQLPDEPDLAGMHRGVLRALLATDSLSNLELPLDMRAPRLEDAREVTQWEMISNLLAQAEGALCGVAHRERIAQLHRVFPGHALQLERLRRQAAQRLRRLRVRVDFVCRGIGQLPAAIEMTQAARGSLLQ
jgi:hypothetical protein